MPQYFIWIISLIVVAGILVRPFRIPEAVWAVAGAILLVVCKLITPADAITGVVKGDDVYLFLTGMMLLAETAREEKLFDWLAAHAAKTANGSPGRLFLLIYLVGIVVTALLSNDATAVVLTPAVAASVKAARVKNPLPYLFICAFIANAASFVLPISNPANLVIYDSNMPSLFQWLSHYLLPSAIAIVSTYFLLRFNQRKQFIDEVEKNIVVPELTATGRTALLGILITVVVLLGCSAMNIQLGLPTAITGIIISAIVLLKARKSPVIVIKNISWSVLLLVAGLFVIVEAINKTGLTESLIGFLNQSAATSTTQTVWLGSFGIALACNLMNNLPVGLIAGTVVQSGHIAGIIKDAILIAVDLGPNLSVTGSLATILWLSALRREGFKVNFWSFLKVGILVMTVPLLLAILSLFLS